MLTFGRLGIRRISGSVRLSQQFGSRPAPRNFQSPEMQQHGIGSSSEMQVEPSDESLYEQPARFNSPSTYPGASRPAFKPSTNQFKSAEPSVSSATGSSNEAGRPTCPFFEEAQQSYETEHSMIANAPFADEIRNILLEPLSYEDIEIKPDGTVYMPESRYRRRLNRAFGPGGWCILPRGAHSMSGNVLSREYTLYCLGQFVSQARGHAVIQGFSNPAMASEAARSNAIMRLCKDLGIGNELWDPSFLNQWKQGNASRRVENGKSKWAKNDSIQP